MAFTNEDLLASLRRADKDYQPEIYTPSEAEQEFGVGSEPLVRLSLRDGQAFALCQVLDDGDAVLCDLFHTVPIPTRVQIRVDAMDGDSPSVLALVRQIEAAARR